jgi:type VI secretion system secreted protein VgrG
MPELVNVDIEVAVDGQPYRALAIAAREGLDEVGSVVVDLTSPDGAPDPRALVGKPVEIGLRRADGSASRAWVGLAFEAERLANQDGRPATRLVVVPRLMRLAKRADCRTFQDVSVPDIVGQVLEEAGVPASDQLWSLVGSYAPRVYCVQYRETDLDFVLRLLSEEGISLAVRFDGGVDKVAFCDDPKGFGDVEGAAELPFAHTYGFETSDDHVLFVRRTHEVKSDKVFVRDYDFERPKLKLEAEAVGTDPGAKALEVYAWPGRFTDQGVGRRYAEVLLDSMQAERDVVSGEATALSLQPGLRFSITEHPYEALNQEYLVVSVETEARDRTAMSATSREAGRQYVCRFTAVPTGRTNRRPPRRPRARVATGFSTAFVTGPSGGEIHTDAHGRVKVRYPWDRRAKDDDTSSLWVRTLQLPTGGSMLLPRVGWEVAVRHVEGDVDAPMVMGRMVNAVAPPPYALPGGKARGALQTATTPGGGSTNEIRTDDTKGSEEMFFNASKDMSITVLNNTTETIGNDETHDVGANHTLDVTNSVQATVGASQTISVGGNQTVHVEALAADEVGGDHTLSIGGNRTLQIGGDHRREVGGASTLTVGGNAIDLVVGEVSEAAVGDLSHSVGAALVEMTAKDRSLVVGGSRTETTGAVKLVITGGGRSVDVTGNLTEMVGGAVLASIKGDRNDNAGASFTEIAAGASIVKADSVTFEADGALSVVMGGSILSLTPASVSFVGTSVKIDGAVAETAAMITDN